MAKTVGELIKARQAREAPVKARQAATIFDLNGKVAADNKLLRKLIKKREKCRADVSLCPSPSRRLWKKRALDEVLKEISTVRVRLRRTKASLTKAQTMRDRHMSLIKRPLGEPSMPWNRHRITG